MKSRRRCDRNSRDRNSRYRKRNAVYRIAAIKRLRIKLPLDNQPLTKDTLPATIVTTTMPHSSKSSMDEHLRSLSSETSSEEESSSEDEEEEARNDQPKRLIPLLDRCHIT